MSLTQQRISLRKSIDAHCKSCVYDKQAAGTWRQQVTLCPVRECSLYPVRPTTKENIAESVLDYYGITGAETARYMLRITPEGPVSDQTAETDIPIKGVV